MQVTELIQGDTYATIGCVVPSLVALHKCLTSLQKTVRYHNGLVRSLLDAVLNRFSGIFINLQMMKGNDCQPNLPYSDPVYIVAAALDPNYGYIWLDADHPGTAAVKSSLKHDINGMFSSHCCVLNRLTLVELM